MADELNYTDLTNQVAPLVNMLQGALHAQDVFRSVLIGEQRLKNLQQDIADLEKKRDDTIAATKDLVEAAKTDTDKEIVEMKKKAAASIKTSDAKVKKLEQKAADIQDQIDTLEKDLAKALEAHKAKMDVLNAEVAEAEAKLKTATDALTELKGKL